MRAIGEVEHGLGRERSLVAVRERLTIASTESSRNARIQENRYRRGLSSVMELLQARDQDLDLRRRIIAIDGEILSNRIALALAVGAAFEEQES